MKKYFLIVLLYISLVSCNKISNQVNSTKTIDSIEIESIEFTEVNDRKIDSQLMGSWLLKKIEPHQTKIVDNLILSFYPDYQHNRKLDGFYSPRVYWRVNHSEIIECYNNYGTVEFAKILDIKKDSLILHFFTDNADGTLVRVPLEK